MLLLIVGISILASVVVLLFDEEIKVVIYNGDANVEATIDTNNEGEKYGA